MGPAGVPPVITFVNDGGSIGSQHEIGIDDRAVITFRTDYDLAVGLQFTPCGRWLLWVDSSPSP